VDQAAVDLTHRLFGDEALVANGYGTTETGVVTFWFTGTALDGAATVPVGHPIPGMEVRIVGDAGRVLAAGETGEVVVVGDHLFAGYRGRPDLDEQVLGVDARTGA